MSLMVCLLTLWIVMPDWFRDFVIAHSPRLDWAFQAAERRGGQGNLETQLHARFSPEAILSLTVVRLKHGIPDEQEFAARHIGWIFGHIGKPEFVLSDSVLRQELIEALIAVAKGGNPRSADAACYALLAMGEVRLLPDLLEILAPQPERWHTLLLLGFKNLNDPLITTYLLQWFRATPDSSIFEAIKTQKDPRAEALIVAVLTSALPGTGNLRRYALRAECRSPEFIAAVRKLCADTDFVLRFDAVNILAATANGLDWMLDVRVDPLAWKSHSFAEAALDGRADELSIDQGYRWITAPPLAVGKVR